MMRRRAFAAAFFVALPLYAATGPWADGSFEQAGERAEAELAAHAPGIGTDFRLRDPAGRVRTLRRSLRPPLRGPRR